LPKKVDTVVIGGGVLGCAAAYYLAKEGLEVLLLEQREIASGASGANLGQTSVLDREADAHLALTLKSLELYPGLSDELGVDLEYEVTGGSYVLTTEAQLETAKGLLARQARRGVAGSILGPREAPAVEPFISPDGLVGLAYCPLEGRLNPLRVTLGFAAGARKNGATIAEHTPVRGFKLDGQRAIAVLTDLGAVRARTFVNAGGAWTGSIGRLAGLDVPVRFHRGTAMVTEPVPPTIRGPVVGAGFLTPATARETRRVGLALNQAARGSVILGQYTEECQDHRAALDNAGLKQVAERVLRHFPGLAKLNIVRAWAAVTPYSDDGLPFFGFRHEVDNLLFCGSFKGAFTTAPAVGRMVADLLVRGRTGHLVGGFSPERS
jgi:sarcosine oxidase subunit beta